MKQKIGRILSAFGL